MLYACRRCRLHHLLLELRFWIFNWVANMVYPRYDLMIGDVRATQNELETTFNEAQEGIEAAAVKLYEKNPERL